MVEKRITLEDVPAAEFFGVENRHMAALSKAFPESKILGRGNEILIKGRPPEILRINDVINTLLEHYNHYGALSPEAVDVYLGQSAPGKKAKKIDGSVIVYGAKGAPIKAKTPNQAALVRASEEHDLVFATGPAGTGKTFISVALAVRALKNKEVQKIIITRPAVEAGENLGFLPGDMQEKIDPYLRPVYDALDEMVPSEKLRFYQENRVVEIAPLAYMRGRTLNNAFILLDEAQNTTLSQMKMFLTRMGPASKIIVTGDLSQIDLPPKQSSGLTKAADALRNIEGVGFVQLETVDVVRHKLVKKIIEALE